MAKERLELILANYLHLSEILYKVSDSELEELILEKIRRLFHNEIRGLVCLLEKESIFSVNHNNSVRRKKRKEEHIDSIKPFLATLVQSTSIQKVLDVGTGDGAIFSHVLDILARTNTRTNNSIIPYSGDITDYCKSGLKGKIGYRHFNATLLPFKADYFDLATEFSALHHLPSKKDYKKALSELVRATKQEKYILVIETVHMNRYEHYVNAILDIYFNNLTSIQEKKTGEEMIPVPVNFLSEHELKKEFGKLRLKVIKESAIPQTQNDPKKHKIYLLQKVGLN